MTDRLAGIDEERRVLAEVQTVTGNQKMRMKDVYLWASSEKVIRSEPLGIPYDVVYCPTMGVYAAIDKQPEQPVEPRQGRLM